MKKLYVTLVLSISGITAYSQNLVNDGGIINIAAGATITLTSDFNNLNAGAVNNQGALELAGNFTAADASNQLGSGIYRFNGSSPQNLSIGTGQISNVELNNPAGLDLLSDVTVTTSLKFVSGHILGGTNTLAMNTVNNAVIGADANKFFVCGDDGFFKYNLVLATDTAFFPIGYSIAIYNPAWFNNTGTIDNFSAQVFNNVLQNGLTGSPIVQDQHLVNRTWNIQEDVAGGTMPTVKLQWETSHQRADFDPTGIAGISYYKQNAGQWDIYPNSTPVQGSNPYSITHTFSVQPDNLGAFIVGDGSSLTVFPESVGETLGGGDVSCSPNPAAGGNIIQLTAKALANKAVSVKLYDLAGRVVATDTQTASPKGSLPFVMPQLSRGMYMLNLTTTEGRYSTKLIVE
jgi:hypothetical protein